MNVYMYTLTLEAPAIISSRRARQNYVTEKQWIPGLTLRGAILTSLSEDANLDISLRNSLAVYPAYPLSSRQRRCFPPHPFIFYDKSGNIAEPPWIEAAEKATTFKELAAAQTPPNINGRKHNWSSALGKFPVAYTGTKNGVNYYEKCTVPFGSAASVSIHRHLRKASYGKLYYYVAVAEGTSFWGLLVDRSGSLLNGGEELEVWVGRATTRGFGKAKLKLRKLGTVDYIAGKLADIARKTLYALSPVAYPETLPHTGMKNVSFTPPNTTIKPRIADGKQLILGKKQLFTSWYVYRGPKNVQQGIRPVFETLTPGSIILLDTPPTKEDFAYILGSSPSGLAGLGLLIPYPNPILKGEPL